jgi:hypothetical protein
MTDSHLPRSRRSSRHINLGSARRPTEQLVSDGVVAGYIHDISRRHGRPRRVSDRSTVGAR